MSIVEISRQNQIFGNPNALGAQFQYDLYYGLVGQVDFPLGDAPDNPGDTPWYWGVDWQKMPDTLSGKPFPIWATGVSNGLVSHYHVDQMRWAEVIAIVGRDNTLDIDLIDYDGVPIVDPSVPPLIVARYAIATDTGGGFPANDFLDDPKIGTWSDDFMNMPLKDTLTTENSASWRLRLNRTPVPHWRITLSTNRIEATPTSTGYRWGFRVFILGNYSGPHTDYLLDDYGIGSGLTSWTHGRHQIRMGFQAPGAVNSLEVVNGTAGDWNRPILCRGGIDVAASSSGTLYPRTPTGTTGGAAVFSTSVMPMCRVLAQTNAATTTPGDETTWVPGSIGLGSGYGGGPFRTANVNVFGFTSEQSWDSGAGEWKVVISNTNTTTTKSFYCWWLGV